MIIITRQKLCKLQAMNIEVGSSSDTKAISQVKILGCCVDSNRCMPDFITNVCKAAFFYLHNIRRIKKYSLRHNLRTLVHPFITSSRLDYCNGLM